MCSLKNLDPKLDIRTRIETEFFLKLDQDLDIPTGSGSEIFLYPGSGSELFLKMGLDLDIQTGPGEIFLPPEPCPSFF